MITIVIPARNEENSIEDTVTSFSKYFPKDDILIVTGGCTDDTEVIAKQLTKQLPNVRWFSTGVGKGRAIYEGLSKAKGEVAGFVDSDLAITPKEFAKLIPYAKDYECVIASRWLPQSLMTKKEPLKTRIASRGLNFIVRHIIGIDVKDTQCGAKIFQTKFLKKLIQKAKVMDITFDVEMLWLVNHLGGRIKEVPIVWKHSTLDSKTHVIKNSIKMFNTLYGVYKRK